MQWTRSEVAEDHLGISLSTLRSYERATGFKPSGAAKFQEFSQATYDPLDIAMLQIIHHGSEIGLVGTELARIYQAAQTLLPFLQPGWRGLCVTTTDGRAWQVGGTAPGPATVETIAQHLKLPTRISAVAPVEVPGE